MALENTHFSNEEIGRILERARNVFFIGIGGVSTSSLATYLHYEGKSIYGYDRERTNITKKLESICEIKYYSTPDRVRDMDLVVYSCAIDENNFEYKMAKRLKIPTLSRANLLGYIISTHKTSIGIAGSHGKSTTVSMLAKIFEYAQRKPTVFCGAYMKEYGGCVLLGKKDVCIFEACEYMDSFLNLPPKSLGILNIDYDHPDYFASLSDVQVSFNRLAALADVVYLNNDDEPSRVIEAKKKITYAIDTDADYKAKITEDGFDAYYMGEPIAECTLKFKGKHFVCDALCALAIAHRNNIAPTVICKALAEFSGVKRRLEFIKKTDTSLPIFEDYAHHPREIEATLSSLLEMGYKRIFCAYQAHTYSRTHFLYDDFTRAFKKAAELYFLPTFSAREKNSYGVDEEKFARDSGGALLSGYDELKKKIASTDCDVVVLMGAGNISNFKNYL